MNRIENAMAQVVFYIRMLWQFFWKTCLSIMLGPKFGEIYYGSRSFKIFGLARLYYVRKIKGSKIVQTRYNGFLFMQPIDNVFINDEILFSKTYERFRKITRKDIVVDAGAHVGIFSLKAASVASRVVSIEPNPDNFKLLCLNVKSNYVNNIALQNCAVADYNGIAKFYLHSQSGRHSMLYKTPLSVNVKVRKLDDLVNELGIGKVSFLKIDTEGAEPLVLKGASKIVKTYRPYIVMECHSDAEKAEIFNLLESLNYSYTEKGDHIYAHYSSNTNTRISC